MEKVLNKGLNFAILPLNLDITMVLVYFKRFEGSFVWKEFWYGKNNDKPYVQPLLKTNKTYSFRRKRSIGRTHKVAKT